MPIECKFLEHLPQPLTFCPKCGEAPFTARMRGQVQRRKYKYWVIGPEWDYCAVICDNEHCGHVVGWESPPCYRVLRWNTKTIHQFCFGLLFPLLMVVTGLSVLAMTEDVIGVFAAAYFWVIGTCLIVKLWCVARDEQTELVPKPTITLDLTHQVEDC